MPGSGDERGDRTAENVVGVVGLAEDALDCLDRPLAHSTRSPSLEGTNCGPQVVRHRRRTPRAEVDQHERLLGRDHQRVVREAVRGALVRHARAPDPAHAHERLDQVVESGRRVVLDRRCAHHELAALGSEPSEMAVVLRACVVEVRQVPPVVDDALRVRVGEPHASQRRVLEGRPPIGDAPEFGDVRHRAPLRTDHSENLVALLGHQRLRERFEVQAQEWLRVRGSDVEVPVVEVDRDSVEV